MNKDRSDLSRVRFPSIREKIVSYEERVEEVEKRLERRLLEGYILENNMGDCFSSKLKTSSMRRKTIPTNSRTLSMVKCKSNYAHRRPRNKTGTSSKSSKGEKKVALPDESPSTATCKKEVDEEKSLRRTQEIFSKKLQSEDKSSSANVENECPVLISDDDDTGNDHEEKQDENIKICTKSDFDINEVIIREESPREDGICSEVDEDEYFDMEGLDEFFFKQPAHQFCAATTSGVSVVTASSAASVTSLSTFSIMSASCLIQSSLSFLRSSSALITPQKSQRINFISDYYMSK